MSHVIEVENLSKAYQIGTYNTGTLSRDIERRIALLRGKDDPFAKIGETDNSTNRLFWSLKDINFKINKGDSVGIIGGNGAGKSTLLKILSQITTPTTGKIKIKGKIASLLEVGTGFHPELTGRENIYLNGAILGMTRSEIKLKFDEIVDFAGINKHVDTPVKRYSSGMYVRLAFAVAANLESDILVVDEVLAVGDADFQKKCLGKMNDLTKGMGRTILFVSHNMASINSLCNSGILLNKGNLLMQSSDIRDIIEAYTKIDSNAPGPIKTYEDKSRPGNDHVRLNKIRLIDEKNETIYTPSIDQIFGVEVEFELFDIDIRVTPLIVVSDYTGYNGNDLFQSILPSNLVSNKKGINKYICWFPSNLFNNRKYFIKVDLTTFSSSIICHASIVNEITFEILESDLSKRAIDYKEPYFHGALRPTGKWEHKKS